MTAMSMPPPGLARRILASPPLRVLVLGFVMLVMMDLNYLTGGTFGVESSVLALVPCTTTGVVMLVMAQRRGMIVPPAWKRSG